MPENKSTSMRLNALCAAAFFATVCAAGEPAQVPEKKELTPQVFRPFKQFPDVLFVETFDTQPKYLDSGKVVSEEPAPPGKHVLKLDYADWGKNDHIVASGGHFSRSYLSVPHGLDPTKLWFQAIVWTDETGEVTIKFKMQKGEVEHKQTGIKPKTWTPITIHISDLRNKAIKPEIDQTIDDVVILYKPLKSRKFAEKEVARAYVSDMVVTYVSKPDEVLPRVMAAEKKRTDALKLLERDGFSFSLEAHDKLKLALKSFKSSIKPKTAVVIADSPEATTQWVKALATASAAVKPRDPGFIFKPAVNPDATAGSDNAAGGLADARIFMQSAIVTDPQFAVIIVGAEDVADTKHRAEDNVRVLVNRTIAEGTIPVIVCPIPTKPEEAKRFEDFHSTVARTCWEAGAPAVSMIFKIPKKPKEPNKEQELDMTKPPVETVETTAPKVIEAMKHVFDNLLKD